MSLEMNRREAIALGFASVASLSLPALAETDAPSSAVVQAHDAKLKPMMDAQITDPQSRWCGAIPDQSGLHHCNTAAGFFRDGAAAYVHPESAFHADRALFERMKLAAEFLNRSQNAQGNIDLISTNFNSPPDTAFVVHSVACAAQLAQMNHDEEVVSLVEGFLRRAGQGLAKGGIHTPNHRWVVCAALAQIHELFPDDQYIKRIDQWMAEGIDIDGEGQFTERSTAGYNAVVDCALVVAAHKLRRPKLLDPVRKNLDAMAYLLHPNGEVVTEISLRQDLNARGTMSGYWFALRYMAIHDGNGLYASMLKPLEPESIELSKLMEYPELLKSVPPATPIPEDYERALPLSGITRIRRGKTSVTIMHKDNSRWIALRRGEAVVNAVRFASSFFGKGQFIPATFEKREDGFHFTQELQGVYFQPLTDPALLPVAGTEYGRLRPRRDTSEVCHLLYEGHIRETSQGIEISIQADGTDGVPLAVEINLREGGALSGVTAIPGASESFLLNEGMGEYRVGSDGIRFGPGHHEHSYVHVRGAQAKLPGPSVYVTGYTPFRHTLRFELA
ncbi:MAG: hypothetical protein WC655_03175 [Candidatus Hydrogenedentales bacterium]|jgi:hypothetical protein